MDNNNWRPNQGADPNMDTSDWRGQLQPESRQRIVNKIMDTLKRHIPVSGQEGLHELWKIAQRFEEKIFTAAISQSDYLRKISLKMLAMETKSQGIMANNIPPNQVGPSNQPPDPGLVMQSQVHNQGQPHPIPLPNQPPSRQQLLSQNIQNNIASQPNLSNIHQKLGNSGNSGMQTSQHSADVLQQSKVPIQQQSQQGTSNLLPSQAQQSQPQAPQQQLMSQIQYQPAQLQQQMGLQQQPNPMQRDLQQKLQASGSLLQQSGVLDQQKQLYQSQRPLTENLSSN